MAISDTWLKEFDEAMKLADDISNRLRERDSILSSGGDPGQLVSSTRRKITVLGTCLDRLESLLQNPPDKPILDDEELYRRQDMLLGVRFKTNQMAASFSTSPTNRMLLHASGKEESACEDRDIFDLSLINKADTARKEKVNASVDIAEDMNLHTPLLSSQESNSPTLRMKTKEKISRYWNPRIRQILSLCCLTIVAVLLLLIVYYLFH